MSTCRQCGALFVPKRKEQVYCSKSCAGVSKGKTRRGQKTGPNKTEYTQRVTKDGHLRTYAAHHQFAEGRREMHVHDMVMEVHLGRRLLPTECVHHINGTKTDNRLENLEVMSHAEHSSLHNKELAKTRGRDSRGRFA